MRLRGIKLGLVQDGQEQAKELIAVAQELKGNKADIAVTMRRIEGLQKDGIANYRALLNIVNRISDVNKQMGIETKIPQLAEMEKALNFWSDVHSSKI
jgi:hypothetical protein